MKYKDIDQQYKELITDILTDGVEDFNIRTKSKVKALPGRMIQIDLAKGFPLLSLRPIPIRTFIAETCFYLQGTNDPTWLQQFTGIWDDFLIDGKIDGSYGYRWRNAFGKDQIKELIELLRKDPTSRHGVVAIWDPSRDGLMGKVSPNVPCPISFCCQIVGGKLCMSVTMRSQDCYLGLPTDIAGFALLTHFIAAELDIKVGTYNHFIVNAHLYENQWPNGTLLLNRIGNHKPIKLKVPQNAIKRATQGDKGLVAELEIAIEEQYKPQSKLPVVKIML